MMSVRARQVLEDVQVVVGYSTYIELVGPLLKGKQVVASGMRKEVERAVQAIEIAGQGTSCALICSGDPGIYALAGLVLEICRQRGIKVMLAGQESAEEAQSGSLAIEVIAGIPALAAGAALLGAPLMHDFASISLSDLLTPWELIEKRLHGAAAADFVIVLYNPRSRRRQDRLEKACRIIGRYRDGSTPAGIVTAAGRPHQKVMLTTLARLPAAQVDMQTTVFIGNSQSWSWNNLLVTPRGYAAKYNLGP